MSVTTANQMQLQNESGINKSVYLLLSNQFERINRVFKVKEGSVSVSNIMDYR